MNMFRWFRNVIRKPIVDRRIRKGRYVPVEGAENAYIDIKRGGILVKGYYDKPFTIQTKPIQMESIDCFVRGWCDGR